MIQLLPSLADNPCVLRSVSIRLLCICALGAALWAPVANASSKHSVATLSSLSAGVLTRLNMIRTEHHLTPLEVNVGLTKSAAQHSAEMTEDGYFAHASAGGGVFWKRLLQYYPQLPAKSWSVGENLLWTSGTLNSQQALALWMASPEHRANILNPTWRDVGVSSVGATDAPGAYDNQDVIVITTDFGVRG